MKCIGKPSSDMVLVKKVKFPGGTNPTLTRITAMMGNTLAIREWQPLWQTLSAAKFNDRLIQKDKASDSEVFYTIEVAGADLELSFYL